MQWKGNLTCDWNILGNLLNFIIKSSCHLIEGENRGGSCFVSLRESFEVTITCTCKQIPKRRPYVNYLNCDLIFFVLNLRFFCEC